MSFKSKILIIPGLGNSGEGHWQSIWEKEFNFTRVNQKEWNTPVCDDWIETIDKAIVWHGVTDVILVGHSLACTTIACWSSKYKRNIKGALLVAPSDTEAETYPAGTSGFVPMSLERLPFPSIVVASTDDYYVTLDRARLFASQWGSELHLLDNAGHINVAAGFGDWDKGLELLKKLDEE